MKKSTLIGSFSALAAGVAVYAMVANSGATVAIRDLTLVGEHTTAEPRGVRHRTAGSFHASPVRVQNASWVSGGSFHAAPVRVQNASWVSAFSYEFADTEMPSPQIALAPTPGS